MGFTTSDRKLYSTNGTELCSGTSRMFTFSSNGKNANHCDILKMIFRPDKNNLKIMESENYNRRASITLSQYYTELIGGQIPLIFHKYKKSTAKLNFIGNQIAYIKVGNIFILLDPDLKNSVINIINKSKLKFKLQNNRRKNELKIASNAVRTAVRATGIIYRP